MKKVKTPIQIFIDLVRYRPILYLIDGIVWTLIHLFPLVPGLLIKRYFDTLQHQSITHLTVWEIIALFVSFSLTRILFIILGFRIDVYHRFNISGLLRRNLLNHLLRDLSIETHHTTSGEAVSNFRDDVDLIEDSVDWMLDLIGTAIFAILAFSILFSINIRLTLYVFGPLIIVLLISHSFSKKIHRYRIDSREATSQVTMAMGEAFGSIQSIQVSTSEDHILSHMKQLNATRHKMMLRDTLFNQILDSIYFNTVNLGTGLILILFALNTSTFTVGEFALFVSYLAFVSDFIMFFGYFIARYQQFKVSVGRLQSLLHQDTDNTLTQKVPLFIYSPSPKPTYSRFSDEDFFKSLTVRHLTYTYPSSHQGIKQISFTLKKGSFTVISGRIGSGKTTLLKAILGLIPIEEGEIYYNEQKCDDYLVFPKAAYTPQIPKLFSDTIEQNILMGLDKESVNLEQAIYQAVLDQDISQFENGLQTLIGPRGVKLSGGQMQRVAAARMFVRDAQLYVLDDISSALDVDTEKELWHRLFDKQNTTCLVVSNKRIALQQATHVIVLKDGQIDAEGSLEEVLASSEEMRQIWR